MQSKQSREQLVVDDDADEVEDGESWRLLTQMRMMNRGTAGAQRNDETRHFQVTDWVDGGCEMTVQQLHAQDQGSCVN